MNERKFAAVVSVIFLFGHLGLLPFILLYPSRLTDSQTLDLLLIVGPMTAAYMVTVTQYVIHYRNAPTSAAGKVNLTYVLFCSTFVLAFFACAYGIVILTENRSTTFAPENIKNWIGGIEVFVGASLALLMKSLFETSSK